MVALLMFGIGVSAYAAWTFFYHPSHLDAQVVSVSQIREDNLHKLYEAAQMVGHDWDTRNMVLHRLMCAKADGVADAQLATDWRGTVGCERADGAVYEFNAMTGTYGVMFEKIRKEHSSWSLKNFEFLKEVSTPEKAKEYVRQHMNDVLP